MKFLAAALLLGFLPALAAHAQTAESAGYVTAVMAGDPDPNGKIPGLNAVPGAGVTNVDLAFPYAVLTHGQQYVVSVLTQNGTFNGTCTSSYEITQVQSGKVVKLQNAKINTYKCGPGTVWVWVILTPAIPDAVGAAKLVGSVKFGTKTVSLSQPIYIQ
jgi:hypothetical protein